MASAADLTTSSFTLHANLFQLFHPIGGVCATPLSEALARIASGALAHTSKKIEASPRHNFVMWFICVQILSGVFDGRSLLQSIGGVNASGCVQFSGRRQICFDCTNRVHAIQLPSGETLGCSRLAESRLSNRGAPPMCETSNNCIRPSASALYTIDLPSGIQSRPSCVVPL